jgi:hypothetical protein
MIVCPVCIKPVYKETNSIFIFCKVLKVRKSYNKQYQFSVELCKGKKAVQLHKTSTLIMQGYTVSPMVRKSDWLKT